MTQHPKIRALVTGGSSPIGAALARELAESGHHVLVHANSNLAAANATVDDILANQGSAEAFALDLGADDAMSRIETFADPDPVQIIVHCAGGQRDMPFAAMEQADWQHAIDVNLNSFFTVARPLILPMMRKRWGRIVCISSLTAVRGNRGQSNYAAAKGGLLPMVKSLTLEYGSRGITANVVAPGLIDTPEIRALPNFRELAKVSPSGRVGTAEEVAAVVGFLCSEKAGYVSGQLISVDGGAS